jgi:hypothetical protein
MLMKPEVKQRKKQLESNFGNSVYGAGAHIKPDVDEDIKFGNKEVYNTEIDHKGRQ